MLSGVIAAGEEEARTFALILRDVSAERQAEAERAALQPQVIEAQRAVIRELSTPSLHLADHVIARGGGRRVPDGRVCVMG